MPADLHVSSHDTEAELYAALARIFGEKTEGSTKWVRLNVDGVRLTFFAPRETPEGSDVRP